MAYDDAFDYFDPDLRSNSFFMFQQMKENGELCDVTVRAGPESFRAHRVVLAAGIPYFRAVFDVGHSKWSREDEIVLEDIDPDALQCLIDFAYSGKLSITRENVQYLLRTAISLKLNRAIEACFQFVAQHMDPEIALTVRTYAKMTNFADVMETADRYSREYFEDVSKSEAFSLVSFLTLKELICSDDLYVLTEETVFEAVLRWVKCNERERAVHLPELLLYVRLPLLTPEYIATRIKTEELILASPLCRELLDQTPSSYPPARERYCEAKHHLKCAKIKGCAMYCVYRTAGMLSVKYYDPIRNKWRLFYHLKEYYLSRSSCYYVVYIQENLVFITSWIVCVLRLGNFEVVSVNCEGIIPWHCGVTLYEDKVYFFGGRGSSSDLVQYLDIEEVAFHECGRIIMGQRVNPGVASLGDTIYVTGGYRDDNSYTKGDDEATVCGGADSKDEEKHRITNQNATADDNSYHSNISKVFKFVEKYSPLMGESVEVSPMLQGRYSHGCVAVNGKVYVCGGYDPDRNPLASAEVYDPLIDQWNFLAPPNVTREAIISLVLYSDKLYAMQDVLAETESTCPLHTYDPSTDQWEPGEPITFSDESDRYLKLVGTDTATWLYLRNTETLPFGANRKVRHSEKPMPKEH